MPRFAATKTSYEIQAPSEKVLRLADLRRQHAERQATLDPTPGALAQRLDSTTVQTPALELIDDVLLDVASGKSPRVIISIPPQEGKSQRASRRFPTWLLLRDRSLRIAIASYEHRTARRWGKAIRDDLTSHSLLPVAQDSSAADEWNIEGNIGGVYSVGIGGALTGRPVEFLIIDDPIKDREQADSQTYRDRVWDWWTDVAVTRLAPRAPVILILTRWHEDDLAGRLLRAPDGYQWRYVNIPAIADHDPEKGQTDVLGREPGEWLVSARGRTDEEWEAKRVAVGSRTFASLYQGRPSPESGDVFKREWWVRYTTPLWSTSPDGSFHVDDGILMQSWDMAFKDTKTSDYVVGQVWLRRGITVYLVDQVRARLSFTDTIEAVRRMTRRWPQAATKLVEDKANGTAVIDSLRSEVGGIIPIEPHGSKYARASAVTPFIEAGNVQLPTPKIAVFDDVDGFIEEAAAFPNGTHDDQVDALSQALDRLMLGGNFEIMFDDKPSDAALNGEPLQVLNGAYAMDPRDRNPFV